MSSGGGWCVGPETVRMLELGHPWIIADAYTKKWPAGAAGDLVAVTDLHGKFIATALLDPGERVVGRVLAREPVRLEKGWLLERLSSALQLRRLHADLGDTTAYRIVNGEGDDLPGLTVDRYGDYLLLQLYSTGWRPHLKKIIEALQELVKPVGIYEKHRPQETRELEAVNGSKSYSRLVSGAAAPDRLEVLENGLTFLVSLKEGLNTGLFLDQRRNRRDLMERTRGKRVLNLFAYTGAFSVAAAAAGASRVTSVDASSGYTDWGRANFAVNRLNPKRHDFIVGDCLSILAQLARENRCYDVVLMDPPSFSTTARSRFTTRGGTADLVAAALPILVSGGLLITSSNHQKVDVADYLKEVRRGALQAGCGLRVIGLYGQPEDFPYSVTFPEGRYLKYAISVKGMD